MSYAETQQCPLNLDMVKDRWLLVTYMRLISTSLILAIVERIKADPVSYPDIVLG